MKTAAKETRTQHEGSWRVGIDIGGTFTDFVLWGEGSGQRMVHKVLTTSDDPSRAVLHGLVEMLNDYGVDPSQLSLTIHATTLITNALIERRGARTALITTDGFRDILEIGTEMRYDTYDLRMQNPEPLVPRPLRFEVKERLDRHGRTLKPLDRERLGTIATQCERLGVQAIAICFMHAFKSPVHEVEAREVLLQILPEVAVSISSEVSPEIREFKRASTTAANAYVQPAASRYLDQMGRGLENAGYRRRLFLMLSSGGAATVDTSKAFPIRLLESGPVAGALATAFLGKQLNRSNLLAFDMGGTTAKLCVVDNGRPSIVSETEVGRLQRFRPGSGLPIRIPVVEMLEIGAGGGSIATVDKMGLMKVGPRSAGANPGPVCYGLGGTEPTVSDADLALGYLSPDYFLGGKMRLDIEGAQQALAGLGQHVGLSAGDAARGIYQIVNENMVSAAKVHLAERGRDPRRYALVAFGGAGPIHAHAIARALKIQEVICPASAGVLSAFGLLSAPISFEYAHSLIRLLSDESVAELESTFAAMEAEGCETLLAAGVAPGSMIFLRGAEMRYVGQGRELAVSLPPEPVTAAQIQVFRELFTKDYQARYGHAHLELPIELVTCRVVARGPDPNIQLAEVPLNPESAHAARKGSRLVWFETGASEGALTDCPVYDRYRLQAGTKLTAPAIVEERESTVVVGPGFAAVVDRHLNLILRSDGGTGA